MESPVKSIPRLKFAHLPTPIEALPRLSAALGGLRLFVKRDDQTGLALGGNKTRKLEFLLAEAQANGARTLITAGAVQSNHCRQTAAAAARHGFACTLVLTGQPEAGLSGNLLLDHLLGAQIVWADRSQRDAVLKQTFDDAWQSGRRPFLIPYGGSSPTGALGYAFALQEMLEQAPGSPMGSPPDWIVFPTSSGGTQAGLALGAKAFGFPGKVLGISIDETAADLQERVSGLASAAADLLGEPHSFSPQEILVDDGYLGQGYGIAAEPEREAMLLFARTEGLLLDPVYTGRAAAGLVDLARRGIFSSTDRVLFWHTGGAPALFAGRYQGLLE
jgi:D-cysteine desulfhydrase family pyridoxal phosphate-dependent enzyme